MRWISGGGGGSLRNTLPRGHCHIKFPHPWGKSSTLLHQVYNPPGWPECLPLGQADDMCIIVGLIFYFLLFLGMGMCDNELEIKENQNKIKNKIKLL